MITETLHIRGNLPNLAGEAAHNMTFQSESHVETLKPRTPIVHPKTQLRIGNWNVDPRRKEKERTAKNNLATHSREGEVRSRVAVLERGAHCSARQESMESTCGGPMRHLGARGQVK